MSESTPTQWYDQLEDGVRRAHTSDEAFTWIIIDLDLGDEVLARYIEDPTIRAAIGGQFSECGRCRSGQSVLYRIDLPCDIARDDQSLKFVLLMNEQELIVACSGKEPHLETSMREIVALSHVMTPMIAACEILDDMLDHLRAPLAIINDELHSLEDRVQSSATSDLREQHLQLRQGLLTIDRHLDALESLLQRTLLDRSAQGKAAELAALREVTDRTTWLNQRVSNQLDRLRGVGDQLRMTAMDELNNSMFRLSIIATVFLPLTFFTGLLGINVGGIPGAKDTSAFWIVCVVLTALAILTFAFLLRTLRNQ